MWRPLGYFWRKRTRASRASRQLAFLPQLGRGLELRQADVRHRLDRNLAALFGDYSPLRLDEEIVTKKRGAAEDQHREQENEKPFHESVDQI